MGKVKLKPILINSTLIILIVLVLGYNLYYFLIAPKLALDNHQQIVTSKYDENTEFINVFNHEQSYYMVKLDNRLIALDEQSKLIDSTEMPNVTATEFGYVNDEFIYVTKNDESEQWFKLSDNQLIFEMEK